MKLKCTANNQYENVIIQIKHKEKYVVRKKMDINNKKYIFKILQFKVQTLRNISLEMENVNKLQSNK